MKYLLLSGIADGYAESIILQTTPPQPTFAKHPIDLKHTVVLNYALIYCETRGFKGRALILNLFCPSLSM